MPWPLTEVPVPLVGRPFSVAEARRLGVSDDALRHPRFRTPFRGVRSLRAGDRSAHFPAERARAAALEYVPRLRPTEVFSHATALVLLGCPIAASPEPHVSILRPGSRATVRGAVGHTHAAPSVAWRHSESGAPLVSPALALTQAAAVLPFRELVIAADHLIRPRRARAAGPIATREELRDAARGARTPGVRRARAAIELARSGAESRMETLLRLVMVAFGIPELPLQVDVHDARGRWIGRFDMVELQRRVIVEYDGEQHRTNDEQYARDARRIDAAQDAGFRVLRFRRADVTRTPRATAERIAAALDVPLTPPSDPLHGFLSER
ncbi:hypothetical protein GCM10009805_02180 [Leucobacter chromiireducens subsp. solipictus]